MLVAALLPISTPLSTACAAPLAVGGTPLRLQIFKYTASATIAATTELIPPIAPTDKAEGFAVAAIWNGDGDAVGDADAESNSLGMNEGGSCVNDILLLHLSNGTLEDVPSGDITIIIAEGEGDANADGGRVPVYHIEFDGNTGVFVGNCVTLGGSGGTGVP